MTSLLSIHLILSRSGYEQIKEGELDKESNMQKMHIANSDKPVLFYNLDVIISVGYRVKSHRGVQFRKWATANCKTVKKQEIAH